MTHSLAHRIIEDLYLRNRNFCSSDYDACLDYLSKIIPFTIHDYHPQDQFNGWVIPPKWDLIKAGIWKNGIPILAVENPLQVIGLSQSFKGMLTLEELKSHLHFDRRDPDSIPYHFRQNYRPWDRDWGFCVTQKFYDSLASGEYQVVIETKESEGYLRVAECTLKGSCPETFVFVAHLDHPGMANDDLAGVAVGVELFHQLSKIPRKFTYRLILVQEIIGSVFYLGKSPSHQKHVVESCFLEMLGSATPLALQGSRKQTGMLEKVIDQALAEQKSAYRKGPFRSIICNDEIVWESYGIPMASLSRFPYPEYHSEKDNPSIIRAESLSESVDVLSVAVKKLDASVLVRKKVQGVLSLANPEYGLYVDPGQPAFESTAPEHVQKLRLLMDILPMLPEIFFVEQAAEEVQLPAEETLAYLKLWECRGLIDLF
jgi:aminopeptidase-like protein